MVELGAFFFSDANPLHRVREASCADVLKSEVCQQKCLVYDPDMPMTSCKILPKLPTHDGQFNRIYVPLNLAFREFSEGFAVRTT